MRMLFILTGKIQTGKTRWLQSLVADLQTRKVPVYGVLAPGEWVASSSEHANADGLEKLGIDNVLLPGGQRLVFGRRRDIAQARSGYDQTAQSARAGLGWHISDEALAQVSAHLASLADITGKAAADAGRPGLLVIDELGRLELREGGGLVEAVRLLEAGPQPAYPHALAVVRESLLEDACALLGASWQGIARIEPDDASREAVMRAFT